MGRGAPEIGQRYCRTCRTNVPVTRNSMVWGCGDLIMVLVTCGAWLVVRFAHNYSTNPWRCQRCGART